MPTVVATGTALWLLGALGLLAAHLVSARPLDIWFTTCVTGVALGGLGLGIFSWQRAAARRGSRTAQEGLDAVSGGRACPTDGPLVASRGGRGVLTRGSDALAGLPVLLRGVAGASPRRGRRHALLGLAQDLRRLEPPIAVVAGRDLLGKRLGPRHDLLVEIGAHAVVSTHAGPYPLDGMPLGTPRRRPERAHESAERPVHWSHDSVQSQMSPSRAASWIGVPVTSTGSP